MGGGWGRLEDGSIRMPLTSAALLLSGGVLAFAGLETAMLRPGSAIWIAFVPALAIGAFAVLRPYFSVAHGELRRRRAFEPSRVREAVGSVTGSALTCAVLGLVALVLAFVPGWIRYLGGGGHAVQSVGTNLLWVLAPIAGVAASALAFMLRKDPALELCARMGERFGVVWEQAGGLYDRFFARPGSKIVGAVEDVGVPAVESGVGRALTGAGGMAGRAERGLPWVPTVLGLAVVLAVVFGLLTEGLRP